MLIRLGQVNFRFFGTWGGFAQEGLQIYDRILHRYITPIYSTTVPTTKDDQSHQLEEKKRAN